MTTQTIQPGAVIVVDQPANTCTHPEDAIFPLQWLPDMGICETCGAVVRFEGGEDGWVTCKPAEFEAIVYKEVIKPADDAISNITSAIYDARDFQEKAECIDSTNQVLKEERREFQRRLNARLACPRQVFTEEEAATFAHHADLMNSGESLPD